MTEAACSQADCEFEAALGPPLELDRLSRAIEPQEGSDGAVRPGRAARRLARELACCDGLWRQLVARA